MKGKELRENKLEKKKEKRDFFWKDLFSEFHEKFIFLTFGHKAVVRNDSLRHRTYKTEVPDVYTSLWCL